MKFVCVSLAVLVSLHHSAYSQVCRPANDKIIIYQPWASHSQIPLKQIQIIKRHLDKEKYTHILMQWSSYGKHRYLDSQKTDWFYNQLKTGKRKLIEGLYYDPDFFNALKLPNNELKKVLNHIRKESISDARKLELDTTIDISGWYLAEEIDDLNWRSMAREKMLVEHLKATVQSLKRISPGKAVYISTFFGGHSSPKEYANFLKRIQSQTGVIWIIQDGQGVYRNPQPNTQLYLKTIKETLPPKTWVGLLENFTELNQVNENRFCPATKAEINQRRQLWCSATGMEPTVYFSLNQLNGELLGHDNPNCKSRDGQVLSEKPQNEA